MKTFLDPNQVLNKLELKEDMLAAEFGCGPGGWAIPLAKRLEKGKVWAFDIQSEKISALESKTVAQDILNIETKICNLEQPGATQLPGNFLDLVLIPNVLFQIEKKDVIIGEAKRVLKKGGQVLIVDWKSETKLGPKGQRVDPEKVEKIARKADLEFKKEFEAGKHHWALIFEKI